MSDYPAEYIETVRLRDGASVQIRPICPEDAPLLQEAFKRLSPTSVYMRFFKAASELSAEEARSLATVNYRDQMAFVGSIEEGGQERLVASARYHVLSQGEPGRAEAAIVVRDDYQQRGLGSQMMQRLIRYARAHGVTAFVATVHLSNAVVMSFIQKSGLEFSKKILEPGVWEITIHL